jgi:CheY-like chemotaxis protein
MNEVEILREKVKNLKVSFVDDEKEIREGTGLFLKKFFDDVVIRSDGDEGLEEFKKTEDFDIIITDILMPRMDGFTMIKHIKEINKDIFTVFITASRSMLNVQKELSDLTLEKPISFKDMMMIMKKLVD